MGAGGQAAEQAQVAACTSANGGGLTLQDMIGLVGLVAGVLGLAVLVHGGERGSDPPTSVAPDDEQPAVQVREGKGFGGVSEEAVAAAVKEGVEAGVRAVLAELEARGSRPLPHLRPLPKARGVGL